jgi:alpha-mannosidase
MTADPAQERIPLYYTFGNHMHWVDMQWLWGYAVLPDSARDMLHFCAETGAKGNINFDGIGYEKMAVEAPDALAALRAAVERGQIEVVGASYGQPYGLFHGGESNVRQRVYGVRAVMRTLGKRPRTFWEEEFDFFPQLPQMLRGVGYEYASLFFQWTWHTPEIPRESLPAIWWEGIDGSRLLTAPRSPLNLHQWPEDFAGLLDSPLLRTMPVPGIVQWLELMPSPDWMCRAELLLPQLHKLMDDPRFELRFATLSEYLEQARPHAEVRRYSMDDVFHGMSLGKNGDAFRRLSLSAENQLLAAESLSAMMGLFGRPYPHWDVYPTWELEEGWRELLSAQHHDNDECEGLCGHVGRYSYERSLSLSGEVQQRALNLLADRVAGEPDRQVIYNPLGWEVEALLITPPGEQQQVVTVPPMGYVTTMTNVTTMTYAAAAVRVVDAPLIDEDDARLTLRRGALSVTMDKARGTITQITSAAFPDGVLRADLPLGELSIRVAGETETFARVTAFEVDSQGAMVKRWGTGDNEVTVWVRLAPELDAVDVTFSGNLLQRPDPEMHAGLHTRFGLALAGARLIHDTPFAVDSIRAQGKTYLRKYPTGEWMTSPQVFEQVRNPFTAASLLDFDDGERGVLLLHDGSQAFLREDDDGDQPVVRSILSMYDAWDEDYFTSRFEARFRLLPHGKIDHAARWKWAQAFRRPILLARGTGKDGDLPAAFSPAASSAPNVVITAFYRETEENARGLTGYAGRGIGFPYVIRLLELNGEPTETTLRLAGRVAGAYETNLLGEPVEALVGTFDGQYTHFPLAVQAREIITIYADLEMGRKQPRNLDAYRFVWATVHRVDET